MYLFACGVIILGVIVSMGVYRVHHVVSGCGWRCLEIGFELVGELLKGALYWVFQILLRMLCFFVVTF